MAIEFTNKTIAGTRYNLLAVVSPDLTAIATGVDILQTQVNGHFDEQHFINMFTAIIVRYEPIPLEELNLPPGTHGDVNYVINEMETWLLANHPWYADGVKIPTPAQDVYVAPSVQKFYDRWDADELKLAALPGPMSNIPTTPVAPTGEG